MEFQTSLSRVASMVSSVSSDGVRDIRSECRCTERVCVHLSWISGMYSNAAEEKA